MTNARLIAATFLLSTLSCAPNVDPARARIRDLGADDPSVREAASSDLLRLARQDSTGHVQASIETAGDSKDAEVAARCRQILEELHFWERLVVVDDWRGGLFDLSRGAFAWRFDPEAESARHWIQRWEGGGGVFGLTEHWALERFDPESGKCLWRVDSAGGSGVVIAGDWVAVGAEDAVCVSLRTGRVRWRTACPTVYDTKPCDCPSVGGVCVQEPDGMLMLDARSGQRRWERKTECFCWFGEIRGGLYGVQWPNGDLPPRPCEVFRFDPATGRQLWKKHVSPEINFPSLWDAGATADLVLLSSHDYNSVETTLALDSRTGDTRWTLSSRTFDLAVEEDSKHAWIGSSGSVLRVDLSDGRVLFSASTEHGCARVALDGGRLLVVDRNPFYSGLSISAYDPSSERRLWRTAIEKEVTHTSNSHYRDDGRVQRVGSRLLLSRSWTLAVIDPETGTILERYDLR